MSDDAQGVEHTYTPETVGGAFVMRIAKEGQATVDGRIFDGGALSWRNPPIPLMFIRSNDPSGNGGHKGSEAVGSITEMWRKEDEDGFATIYGKGYFSNDETGQEARQLIQEGVISGVSADVGGAVVEVLSVDDEQEFDGDEGGPKITKRITAGEIVAVTCLPIPAFDDVKVSVTAASFFGENEENEWSPPSAWFSNPNLEQVTPLTVTEDGQVFGHVAAWGTCHIGYKDRCVTPPRSRSKYQYFNVGQVVTADGSTVNVGRLTAGTNHASMSFGAQPAADHYDHTGWAAAYVTSGEDSHGIWVSGAVSPTATKEQVATLRASSISGDWRNINGNLEMVGILAVNSPGFPMPRVEAGIVAGSQMSLVAAGVVVNEELRINMEDEKDCGCGCDGAGDCEPEENGKEAPSEEELSKEKVTEDSVDTFSEDEKDEEDFEALMAEWDIVVLFPYSI